MTGGKAKKLKFVDEASRPGVHRADWHGGPFTVVRYTYAPGTAFPSHNHHSAQLTVVLAGRIRFNVEGEEFNITPGEAIFIPGGAVHGAEVPPDSDTVVSLNVFHPPRKEHP